MRSVLILYVMCISCVIHVENGALMYRTDFMDAHNNNKNKEWAESDYAGQLFVQNNRDVHLVARKTANKNNRHFFGRIIIPCKCCVPYLYVYIHNIHQYTTYIYIIYCRCAHFLMIFYFAHVRCTLSLVDGLFFPATLAIISTVQPSETRCEDVIVD